MFVFDASSLVVCAIPENVKTICNQFQKEKFYTFLLLPQPQLQSLLQMIIKQNCSIKTLCIHWFVYVRVSVRFAFQVLVVSLLKDQLKIHHFTVITVIKKWWNSMHSKWYKSRACSKNLFKDEKLFVKTSNDHLSQKGFKQSRRTKQAYK